MPDQHICHQCQNGFVIDDRDRAFYKKMDVPEPTMCSDCRLQRRLAWHVDCNLYIRKCDLTRKEIISILPQNSSYTVYDHEVWFGDQWNALDHGKEFDFSRPFFEQFNELIQVVPLMAQNAAGLQNCRYVNQCGWSKNCYFTIEAEYNEDSMYSYRIFYSKTCIDCTEIVKCERCYECTDCTQCFSLHYSQLCEQCRDSAFLFDCRSCNNCFGCVGLRQKKFCIFNEQLSEEEYKKRMEMFDSSNQIHMKSAREHIKKLKMQHPRKSLIGEQNDNVSGDYIFESKDCFDCSNIRNCRDCRYCIYMRDIKDCMDCFVWGNKAERLYEIETSGYNANNIRFCVDCWEGIFDLTYCFQCVLTSGHCFGCIGLKKKEYCILNKQYTKDEYETLVPRIIEHMKSTGEWGEFFPSAISPYCYNETTAQEYFPLTKDEVTKRGLRWQDNLPFTTGKETINWNNVPENINDVPDSIVDEILLCEKTGKNFRITKQELLFYKTFHIPIPHLHPDERHKKRMALRNPRKLYKRNCDKCGKEIETTYSPDRPEIVYCEECYLKEVY